jgi:hypothetical protein
VHLAPAVPALVAVGRYRRRRWSPQILRSLARSTLMVKCCWCWGPWCGSAASRWFHTLPRMFTCSTLIMLKPDDPARRSGVAFPNRYDCLQSVKQPDTRSKDCAFRVHCLPHKSLAASLHAYHSSQSAYARNECSTGAATLQQASDVRSHPYTASFPPPPGWTHEIIQ